MNYLAHIDQKSNREQTIMEHLTGTAKRAAAFAKPFGAEDEAYLCGLLHDLGKYSAAFQKRLRGGHKVDHSTAGAQVAQKELLNPEVALCVAGHHTGLPDLGNRMDPPDCATFCGRMSRKVEDFSAFRQEVSLPAARPSQPVFPSQFDQQFYIRMLYSCLVDGDFLDTENFSSDGHVQRGGAELLPLKERLDSHIAPWWNATEELNQKRCAILRAVMDHGGDAPGLFTLTVPTGGGKTVTSMAFALEHALRHAADHPLRRVVYVIPYCSILEQTQKVFEEIFGAENVVAHYANVDYTAKENDSEADKRYLATENWDAPIILTTAVQFFESLYANRSSRCRKLHNLADSILIFDEAQMLPVPYLIPCVAAISELVRGYGCSAVLCTATQPALGRLFARPDMLPDCPARELCPEEFCTDPIFRRVTYCRDGLLSDEALAERLMQEKQVLCVVNSRKQAQDVFHQLEKDGGAYHLSTTMYPAHRRRMLEEIREKLKAGAPCRVISTSLIEAGVDVDFPIVYRAMAGLDSIIQAAGRCNREGKRPAKDSLVHIFQTERRAPDMLKPNLTAAERTLDSFADPSSGESICSYFEFLLYCLKDNKALDQHQIFEMCSQFAFAKVAEQFHIIDSDEDCIYLPLEEGERLIAQYRASGPSRNLLRQLGQYSVGVRHRRFQELEHSGAIMRLSDNSAVLLDQQLYDEKTGLSFENGGGQAFDV